MQKDNNIINSATFGLMFAIIFFIMNLDKLPFVEVLGISIAIGLLFGLLSRGISKLMNKSKST